MTAYQRMVEVPLNRTDIPQSALNITDRKRTNLFAWNGQFSPQLIEVLLSTYTAPGQTILDPFAGSGTVLYEAGRRHNPAVGVEINPAAYKMASIYKLMNVSVAERYRLTGWLDDALADAPRDPAETQTALLKLLSTVADIRIREILEALIINLDFYKKVLNAGRLWRIWRNLKKVILELPFSENSIVIHNCDSRTLPDFGSLVDCVITSPPYINVFNYHQQYRRSAEAMGWNLLQVAHSEIGANRKHRANRYLTVIQYCLDMAQALGQIAGRCRPEARLIFVVGRETSVRGVTFSNSHIIHLIATGCAGLETEFRQERCFKNRFGQLIYEDILHFRLLRPVVGGAANLEVARLIAQQQLHAALAAAPAESVADINAALTLIAQVKPSPNYHPELCRRAGP